MNKNINRRLRFKLSIRVFNPDSSIEVRCISNESYDKTFVILSLSDSSCYV